MCHSFRDPALLELALTHASLGTGARNERLEFLGDAVLGLLISEELYRAHPGLSEGELSQRRAKLVSRHALAVAARDMDLAAAARTGNGLAGAPLPGSVLANLYEAVLAAIYLDGGLEAARAHIFATLGPELERAGESCAPAPKQALQAWSQQLGLGHPRYVPLRERGQPHSRAFMAAAEVGGRRFPCAWGRSRKEAEHWAAHEALLVLRAERQDSDRNPA